MLCAGTRADLGASTSCPPPDHTEPVRKIILSCGLLVVAGGVVLDHPYLVVPAPGALVVGATSTDPAVLVGLGPATTP